MSNNIEANVATSLSDGSLNASEADPLSQTRGPHLLGVKGSALEPQGCHERGFFRPTTPTKQTKPTSQTKSTLPSKQTISTKPAEPANATSPARSTRTTLSPNQPTLSGKPENCPITSDSEPTEEIEEGIALIVGNKTLVLNSVLAFVHNILGPINSKLVTNQLNEFYSRKKLLKAYKLATQLLPQKRELRNTPDPITWKTLLICQHIVNTVQILRSENIWFASLNLDVPLVPLYDISKSPETGSSNSIWKFLTNRKSKPFLDKYTQCDLGEFENCNTINIAKTSGINNASDNGDTLENAKKIKMKVIEDIPKNDKNISINSVKTSNEMKLNNIPENISTESIIGISEINLVSEKVTNSEVMPIKDQINQTEISNRLPEITHDSDKTSVYNKSDNENTNVGCGSVSAVDDMSILSTSADKDNSPSSRKHNIMIPHMKTNTVRLLEDINPLTATKDMGKKFRSFDQLGEKMTSSSFHQC